MDFAMIQLCYGGVVETIDSNMAAASTIAMQSRQINGAELFRSPVAGQTIVPPTGGITVCPSTCEMLAIVTDHSRKPVC